jgi:Fic family protein
MVSAEHIIPFAPKTFPPRRLNKKSFLPFLQRAKSALQKCAAQHKQIPHSFLFEEASDSIESSKNKASINNYLKTLKKIARTKKGTPFTKKQICHLHKMVKQNSPANTEVGKYRKQQNWIGPKGCTIDQAYFYPPAASQVDQFMQELLEYMNSNRKEPLLQLALGLAQLLIIHPFMDGNGRVARLLVSLFLYQKKLLPIPFFPISGYIRKHQLKYFQTLYRTTDENVWEDWIIFFLKAVVHSANRYKKFI